MPYLEPYIVGPRAMTEQIIQPAFSDVIGDNGTVTQPSTEEGDWSLIDGVTENGRPIIDLFSTSNILKRKDASCGLIYEAAGRATNRRVYADSIYAASRLCQDEFYQGDFADYEAIPGGNSIAEDRFFSHILEFMEMGVHTDLFSNRWFGKVSRQADPSKQWSWNKFDGVFTKIAYYISTGLISAANQTFTIAPVAADGTLTPLEAYNILDQAYHRQDGIMRFVDRNMKAFYVDQDIYDAYDSYLRQTGGYGVTIQDKQGFSPNLRFRNIEVKAKPWDGILAALNGGIAAHACMLTLKGNFIYAFNSAYGGGARRNEAIRVWWSDETNTWQYQIFLRSGTELVAPQHIVLGMTAGLL